jgi:hypothetical protein
MPTNKEILSKEFELMKQDLIKIYDLKGMRSSGKWAQSLRVEIEDNHATLYGLPYSQQLETGRKAGKYPNIKDIKQWILDKGVFTQALREITLSSLAFLIARKIATYGWKREGEGGVELISSVVNESRWQKIIDEVGVVFALEYSTQIEVLFNELQAA